MFLFWEYIFASNFRHLFFAVWGRELGPPSFFVSKFARKTLQKVPVVHEDENLVLLHPLSQNPSEIPLQRNPVMEMRTRTTWFSIVLLSLGTGWSTVLCLSHQKTYSIKSLLYGHENEFTILCVKPKKTLHWFPVRTMYVQFTWTCAILCLRIFLRKTMTKSQQILYYYN
jgi:hypothetical protein